MGGPGGAAGNLHAAMSKQSSEEALVEAFLGDLKLDRYVSIFIENGFDCMEVVEAMEESHMRETDDGQSYVPFFLIY